MAAASPGHGDFESLSALSGLSREWGGPDAAGLARDLLAGEAVVDPDAFARWLREALARAKPALAVRTARFMVPGAVCGVGAALLGRRSAALPALRFACRVAAAGLLAGAYLEAASVAKALLTRAVDMANGIAPVLVSAAALTGRPETAAFVTPMTALCAAALENGLLAVGLPLCGMLAAMGAAGGLSDSLRLEPVFDLGRRLVLWGVALTVAAFMGMLSAQGLLAAGRDGAASRAARFAVESLVPIIGGEISDALGSLTVSAGAARNAVGIAATALVAGACAGPLARIAIAAVAARLAGALSGVAGDDGIARMGARFGEAMEALFAMCLGGALLVLLLAGGTLTLGATP